jgi:DNA-binding transcriptional ArsR family regulator
MGPRRTLSIVARDRDRTAGRPSSIGTRLSRSGSPLDRGVVDSFARVLWWLFSSSAGATMRARVISALRREPKNAQQLARELSVDYTTIRHHLKVLQANRLIETSGEHYGQVYSVASTLEARWAELETIMARHRAR